MGDCVYILQRRPFAKDGNVLLDNVVLAPMKEEANGNDQPLECAWTNVETDVESLVPAPRLELGTP